MDSLSVTSDLVAIPEISIVYMESGNFLQSLCGFIIATSASDTNSPELLEVCEPDITPYEYSLASGALDFWEDEDEDIYSPDDG